MNPSPFALLTSKKAGQLLNETLAEKSSLVTKQALTYATMSSTFLSFCFFTKSRFSLPPTASNASRISPTFAVIPGRFTVRDNPNFSFAIVLAKTRFRTTVFGEQIHISRSSSTGKILSSPLSGSLTIPDANEDAAADGAPGRTMIVGSRTTLPSIRPRLEKSLIKL